MKTRQRGRAPGGDSHLTSTTARWPIVQSRNLGRSSSGPRRMIQDTWPGDRRRRFHGYDRRRTGSALKGGLFIIIFLGGGLFLLAVISGFEGPTHTLERALPQADDLALPCPLLPSDCATHACPPLTAALASTAAVAALLFSGSGGMRARTQVRWQSGGPSQSSRQLATRCEYRRRP